MQLVVCSNLQDAGTVSCATSSQPAKLLWNILTVTERAANARWLLNALYILTVAQLLLCRSGLDAELLIRRQSNVRRSTSPFSLAPSAVVNSTYTVDNNEVFLMKYQTDVSKGVLVYLFHIYTHTYICIYTCIYIYIWFLHIPQESSNKIFCVWLWDSCSGLKLIFYIWPFKI
jgi:hypothetical protein